MSFELKILKYVQSKETAVSSSDLVKKFDISRQMASRYLKSLVLKKQLIKTGSTRNALYSVATKSHKDSFEISKIKLKKNLNGLSEDQVFSEVELRLNLKSVLSSKIHSIAYYSFTEMLNNAIDHSRSKKVEIEVLINQDIFSFHIKDLGTGIFNHAKEIFKLESEFEALEQIIKGKQTTFPEAHSGQGIFFTSRIADVFSLKSHRILFKKDNLKKQTSMAEVKFSKGTEVAFQIKRYSRKNIKQLFDDYANADFEFDRTDVVLKLKKETKLISRSQAKRLLYGLDDYKIITLDFKNVKEIGQGFVDEIFRVYKNRHLSKQLLYINTNQTIEFMILRCLKEKSRL